MLQEGMNRPCVCWVVKVSLSVLCKTCVTCLLHIPSAANLSFYKSAKNLLYISVWPNSSNFLYSLGSSTDTPKECLEQKLCNLTHVRIYTCFERPQTNFGYGALRRGHAYRLIDDAMEIYRYGLLLSLANFPFFVKASGSLSPRPALRGTAA